MKNSMISIQWSELSLIGSICLFISGANQWLAGSFLALSILGIFFRYAIEQQEQKTRSESLAKTIKDISEALGKPGANQQGQSVSDVYAKLFNFGADIDKKTSH